MFRPPGLLLVIVLAFVAVPAMAQHSDVEFDYQNGEITIHGAASSNLDASWLFEGDFPVSGPSQNFSSDPGFASEVAEGLGINPGDDIFINFLLSPSLGGALHFHDGTSFQSTLASILVEDNSPATTDLTITAGGFSGGNPAFLQTADSIGDIHSHVDFTLSSGAAPGAYGILMELQTSSAGISNSDSFWFVFNHGLDEDLFDDIVLPEFGATSVPEPGSAVVLGLAAVFLGVRRRRS